MPIYDYVCSACAHRIEVVHSIHATGPSHCDRCGGPMRKALSAPAIVFKGSGWAKKDARTARSGAPAGESASGDQGSSDARAGDGATKNDSRERDAKPTEERKPAGQAKPAGETKRAAGDERAATGGSSGSSTSSD